MSAFTIAAAASRGLRPTLVALLVLAPLPAAATELGRLFFTPAERAALARERALPTGSPAAAAFRLTGSVSRSGQRATIWLNGQPQYQGGTGLRFAVDADDSSRIGLYLGQRPALRLRVGEVAQ